jgi:hypothetical protein
MKGFSTKWISWIKSFVMGGSVAVNVNGEVGISSKQKKAFDKEIHSPQYCSI